MTQKHPAYFCKEPCSADASQLCGATEQVCKTEPLPNGTCIPPVGGWKKKDYQTSDAIRAQLAAFSAEPQWRHMRLPSTLSEEDRGTARRLASQMGLGVLQTPERNGVEVELSVSKKAGAGGGSCNIRRRSIRADATKTGALNPLCRAARQAWARMG